MPGAALAQVAGPALAGDHRRGFVPAPRGGRGRGRERGRKPCTGGQFAVERVHRGDGAGEWRVDEIEMAYIAVPIEGTNDARLLPVWRFLTEHSLEYAGKEDPSQTTTLTDRGDILFNALDGTELLKNNGSI